MQCANPKCSKELLYLREGRLGLLELESDSDDQVRPDDGAFEMKSLPSRFFRHCGECAKMHIIKRRTASRLVLESHAVKNDILYVPTNGKQKASASLIALLSSQ
jgi:hypothetical protein